MSDFDTPVIYADCRSCARPTRHETLFQHVEELEDEYYHEKDTWQVTRCLGCMTVGFLHRQDDFNDVEEDTEGNVKHATKIKTYPGALRNHHGLQGKFYLPPLIRKIYEQTLKAFSEQANVLGSMGLRACIEAVCNDLELSANNLERRIDQLYKAGHVSNGDKKRLHAIRFLGNDAAHEIKEPSAFEIRIALEIVEHMLNTVYILDRRARSLETVAETYEDFSRLLLPAASAYKGESIVSLLGLLGRQRRLVSPQLLDSFETQLKNEISNGKIPFLALGQIQTVAGKEVQLYEIKSSVVRELEDDIPF